MSDPVQKCYGVRPVHDAKNTPACILFLSGPLPLTIKMQKTRHYLKNKIIPIILNGCVILSKIAPVRVTLKNWEYDQIVALKLPKLAVYL